MTRKVILSLLFLLMCGFTTPSYADDWDTDDWDQEFDDAWDKGSFEGSFEACLQFDDLTDDDKQCICIKKIVKSTLSPEDYQKAMELTEQGRTGSAGKIFKKALSAAYDACF